MKNSRLTIFLAIAWLSFPGPAHAMCGEPGDVEFDACISASDADTDWRYLAIYEGSQPCPEADNWSGSRLFSGLGELPPGLKDYCVYEVMNSQASVSDLEDISCDAMSPPAQCLTEFGPDSLSLVYATAQTVESLVVNDFNDQFLRQAGAVGPLPAGPQNVRISMVDTEPSGLNQDRNDMGLSLSDHGFSLLNLMRRLACPFNGSCGVELHSQLGLPLELCSTEPGASCQCSSSPLTRVCEDPATGGYVGTQSELARAIYASVVDWEATTVQRLVLNLSVGWEPVFGGQPPLGANSLPIQAVAAALQYASCRGALVIAAAGNRVPGPTTLSGPLYPGGWEEVEAPDSAQCFSLLGGPPDPTTYPVPAGVYRPLVHAAAAIDHAGGRVETRPGGESRLTAFGDHAVTNSIVNMNVEPTAILTGSSVATAVVSSAAAAAWFHRPSAPGYAIMGQIYAASPGLGRSADFCLDSGAGCSGVGVRRVNVCESVNAVCASVPGPACPSYTCPVDVPVLAPVPVSALAAAFGSDPEEDIALYTGSAAVPACGGSYTLHWKTGPAPGVPCPHLQYYGIQATPYADGQPSGQACEGCIGTFASPGDMYIEVKAEFQETLEHITVLCGDDAYRLPGVLQPGDRLTVKNIPAQCEFEELALAFRATRNGMHRASVVSASLTLADQDDDGVQDANDNCLAEFNPLQLDTDIDGIGNRCDADLNNDCVTNAIDLGVFRTLFFTSNPLGDLNGDGIINTLDLGLFKGLFFAPPGPSGLPNPCSP